MPDIKKPTVADAALRFLEDRRRAGGLTAPHCDELAEIMATIERLRAILSSEKLLMAIIVDDGLATGATMVVLAGLCAVPGAVLRKR